MEQQRFQSEMDKLQHALEAKEAQMQRVVNGTGQVSALKQHYDRVLTDLAGERDVLQADRTRLLQVCCVHQQTHCASCLSPSLNAVFLPARNRLHWQQG